MCEEALLRLDCTAVGHCKGKLVKVAHAQKVAEVRECFVTGPVATLHKYLSESTVWLQRMFCRVTFQGI